MDYSSFVLLRGKNWDEFESRLALARASPRSVGYQQLEDLAFSYRQVLHDHALAASRYPGTGAARRLGRLILEGTSFLHHGREEGGLGFLRFWSHRFPRAFRRNLANLLVASGIFFVAALFGLALAIVQVNLATAFLGPGTVRELESGHLWTESLVRAVPPSLSSSAIATNNMSVALTGWAGGVLAGAGSLYVLFLNGFILGAVFGVTVHYSLAANLLEFVSAHGPLEITLILVTSSAGLSLGRALVAAEDRPRADVLREAGREALVVLLGCLPWFVVLGIVEGFLSPSSDLSRSFKAALGLALLSLFLVAAWNPFLPEEES